MYRDDEGDSGLVRRFDLHLSLLMCCSRRFRPPPLRLPPLDSHLLSLLLSPLLPLLLLALLLLRLLRSSFFI